MKLYERVKRAVKKIVYRNQVCMSAPAPLIDWDYYRFRHEQKEGAADKVHPRYMVLQRRHEDAGVFSDVIVMLVAVDTMTNWGYIPIIDLKNCPRAVLQSKDEYGKENAWEYFFEQPAGITLKLLEASMDVCYCPHEFFVGYDCGFMMRKCLTDKNFAAYWKSAMKKYIHLNQETLNSVNSSYQTLMNTDERVVGVAIREGYVKAESLGVQAVLSQDTHVGRVEDFIEDVSKLLQVDKGITKVFVTCEYQSTIEKFINVFGNEKIIFITLVNKYRHLCQFMLYWFHENNKPKNSIF